MYRSIKTIFTLSFFMLCMCAWAQDTRTKRVSVELGFDGIYGIPNDEYIRAEASYYGEAEKDLEGLSYRRYIGIKGEVQTLDNKFGLSCGLRYTYLNSSLGRPSYYSSSSDFFYFLIKQTENSIEYFKVKEITQSSHYLGIPVEVNWYPFMENFLTCYFKASAEVGYRVSTKTTVAFVNREMNPLQDAVTDRFEEPRNVMSTMGASVGVKIGKSKKVAFTLETGPWGYLNNRTSGIVDLKGGFGIQFNLHLVL
ncbi:MAG: hypothetical protein JNK18_15645 [Cyclobacteriaceae bacterium]|nr:hypothetical protein [Cyclobacteriaceae bacterium]